MPDQASEGRGSAHHTKSSSSTHRARVLSEGVPAQSQRVGAKRGLLREELFCLISGFMSPLGRRKQ